MSEPKMLNKVTFFNHYHNGDLHISRGLVRKVVEHVKKIKPDTIFQYAHRNNSVLLSDISDVTHTSYLPPSDHDSIPDIGDTTYFNTWYGQQHYRFMSNYGISFDCLYSIFDESCKKLWNFSLDDISTDVSSFFPTIDYSKFDLQKTKDWLKLYPQPKVFVANGLAMSGQSINFPLIEIIYEIATRHPDKIFILSNTEPVLSTPKIWDHFVVKHYKYLSNLPKAPNNVIQSARIINSQRGSDLNENAFLASQCDTIIGRASGTFTFSLTRENLFERPTKFICFSNLIPQDTNKFWLNNLLKDKVEYAAKFMIHDEWIKDKVVDIIEKEL